MARVHRPTKAQATYREPDFDMHEGETPEAYYRRLAKAADQRLLRIERLAGKEGYKDIKTFSYARAISDIQIYNPKGTRFNAAISKDPRILKEQTMSVLDFLQAPTSTKYGIDTNFKNSIETINNNFHTGFTWSDAAAFFIKEQHKGLFKQVKDSGLTLRAIGKIRNMEESLGKGVLKNTDLKIAGPEKDAIIKILSDRRRKYIGTHEYTDDFKKDILNALDPLNEKKWMKKFGLNPEEQIAKNEKAMKKVTKKATKKK